MRELPDSAPFWDRVVTLIIVRPDRSITFTHLVGEKEEWLRVIRPDDMAIVAWTGNYTTDLFTLSPDRIAQEIAKRDNRGT